MRNGNGKRYKEISVHSHFLKFVGKYLNDKKIQGIEYEWKEQIISKIEKNGKINEFYYNGSKRLEGELKKGKIWNAKGFSPDHKIIFEIIKGKGAVYYYYPNYQLKFIGEYINGEKMENLKNIIMIIEMR